MHDDLMLLAALLANLIGMGWLALAMESHWRQVYDDAPRGRIASVGLRVLGAAALLTSLFLCLRVDHPTMAALVWVMALAAATLTVAFSLSWRARWLRMLVPSRRRGRDRSAGA